MTESEALQSVVMARIRELIGYRRWLRAHRHYRRMQLLDIEYRDELRALVRLVRMARKVAAASPDPLSQYKSAREFAESYHDWQAAGPQ